MPELEPQTDVETEAEAAEIFFNPKIRLLGGQAHGREIGDSGQQTEQIGGQTYRRVSVNIRCAGLTWRAEFLVCRG